MSSGFVYVTKPYSPRQLLAKIRKFLGNTYAARPRRRDDRIAFRHRLGERLGDPEVEDQQIRSVPVLSSETPPLVLTLYCRLPPASSGRIAGTIVIAVGILSVLRGVDHQIKWRL
jgi:hypothetical protein